MSRLPAILILAVWSASWSAGAEPLSEAAARALRGNPDVREAELGVRSATEGRRQALSAYLPSIDLTWSSGVSETTRRTPAGVRVREDLDPSESAATITQELYTGGERGAQGRIARARVTAAEHLYRARRQQVLLNAVSAYVGVLRDAAIVSLSQDYVASLEEQVRIARRRLELGDASRTDVSQAEARAAGARAALASVRAQLESTRARYVEVIGEPAVALDPPAPPDAPPSLEHALSAGLAANPSVLEAEALEAAAEANIRSQQSGSMPQIALVGRVSETEDADLAGDGIDDSRVGVQVRVPIFQGGLVSSRVRQSRIEHERARSRSVAIRRQVETQIVSAWSSAAASREVAAAAAQQVEAAEVALQGAERERGLGIRTTLDVLNAELEWRDAQVQKARADAEIVIAAYALLAAIGALDLEVFEET